LEMLLAVKSARIRKFRAGGSVTMFDVPKRQRTFRLTDRTLARIAKAAKLLDQSEVGTVEEAIAHLLSTLERGEPVHRVPPSELHSASDEPPPPE
jgi:hypothetical protein